MSRDEAVWIIDSDSPEPAPRHHQIGAKDGEMIASGGSAPSDAIVIESDEESQERHALLNAQNETADDDSFVVAEFRPSNVVRINVDEQSSDDDREGARGGVIDVDEVVEVPTEPLPRRRQQIARRSMARDGLLSIISSGEDDNDSDFQPSPDDSGAQLERGMGSSSHASRWASIWQRICQLPTEFRQSAISLYNQLEQQHASEGNGMSIQSGGGDEPNWGHLPASAAEQTRQRARRHRVDQQQQRAIEEFERAATIRQMTASGLRNAAVLRFGGLDNGSGPNFASSSRMPGMMPADPDVPGIGIEDLALDFELNDPELLGEMVEGTYRGTDAMASLYGNEGVDVGRLPVYADEAFLRSRGLKATLQHHQLQGVQWMLRAEHRRPSEKEPVAMWKMKRNAADVAYYVNVADPTMRQRTPPVLPRGGINADAMGLGKTLQVIALALADRNRVPRGRKVVSLPSEDGGSIPVKEEKKVKQGSQEPEKQEDEWESDESYASLSETNQSETESEAETNAKSDSSLTDDDIESTTEPESDEPSGEGHEDKKGASKQSIGAKRKLKMQRSTPQSLKKSKSPASQSPRKKQKNKKQSKNQSSSTKVMSSRAKGKMSMKGENKTDEKKDAFNETTLVICPLSVLQNWTGQVDTHCSHRVTYLKYYGDSARRMRAMKGAIEFLGTHNFVFTTYDTLRGEYRVRLEEEKAKEERSLRRMQNGQTNDDENDEEDEEDAPRKGNQDLRSWLKAADKGRSGTLNGSKSLAKSNGKVNGSSTAKGKARKRSESVDSFLADDFGDDPIPSDSFETGDSDDEGYGSDDSFIVNDMPKSSAKKAAKSKRTKTPLLDTRWRRVVLDEAHICRNPKTALYQSICQLTSQRRWGLTGTPIVNSTADLGSLASWCGLDPFADPSRNAWKILIEDRIKQSRNNPESHNFGVGGHILKAVVRSIVLRRHKSMKDASGNDIVRLPKVTFYKHTIPMNKSDRNYYERCEMAARERIEGWINEGELSKFRNAIFLFLLRLRQLACSRRLVPPALLEDIANRDWTADDARLASTASAYPLSEQDIKLLQEKLLVAVQMNDDCPVCMEPLLGRDPIITHCAHPFCKACIVALINNTGSMATPACPMDRRPLTTNIEMLVGLPPESDTKENTPDMDAEAAAAAAEEEEDDEDDDDDSGGVGGPRRSAKVRECLNIIRMTQKRDPTEKILVFSNFVKFLNVIAEALKEDMVEYCRFDGGMDVSRRDAVRERFSEPITPMQAARIRANVLLQEHRREERRQARKRAKEEAEVKPEVTNIAKKEEEAAEASIDGPQQAARTLSPSSFLDSLRKIELDIKTTNSSSKGTKGKGKERHVEERSGENNGSSKKKKNAADDVFGHNPSVMLISMGCGSLGLNLTAASTVIMMDPWWQSSIEQQAIDRVHRIGQTRDVCVFQMIAKDSVEDRVLAKQAYKESITAEAFSGIKSRGTGETARQKHETGLRDLATLLGVDSAAANDTQGGGSGSGSGTRTVANRIASGSGSGSGSGTSFTT